MSKIVASVSALAVIVGATVACSSSPGDNDPPPLGSLGPSASATTTSTSRTPTPSPSNTGTASATPSSTPSTDAPDSGTPGTPTTPTNTCSSETTFDACYDCCVTDPTAMDAGDVVFRQCACAANTCRSQCQSNFCSNQAPTAACEQCLQNQSACQQQAETACDADAKCKAATTCLDTSGCDAKP